MINRRLAVLLGAVAALVAIVGLASHGRPLSASRGTGPTATFFDYVATTLVIFAIIMLAVFVWALLQERTGAHPPERGRWHMVSYVFSMLAGIALAFLIVHSHFQERLRDVLQQQQKQKPPEQIQPHDKTDPSTIRNARLRWDEIAIVLVLLGGTAVVLVATRQARRPHRSWRLQREERVAQAFDESLDDLRNDPDLRRAIIAAYARMERALASVGLARRPSEAPFEYVARALASLDTSADAAERLTALFEWAKFSQHEPRPEMRHEAIEALEAVRDELRQPAPEAVPA